MSKTLKTKGNDMSAKDVRNYGSPTIRYIWLIATMLMIVGCVWGVYFGSVIANSGDIIIGPTLSIGSFIYLCLRILDLKEYFTE